MGRWRVVVAVASLLAVGLAVWTMVSTDPGPLRRERAAREAEAQRLLEVGREKFATLTMRPITDVDSPSDLAPALLAAEKEGDIPADGVPAEVVALARQFLWMYLVNEDPVAYRQWRVEEGYAPRSQAWAHERWIQSIIPAGSPAAAEGATLEERFDAIWTNGRTAMNGAGKPVGMPADPAGWVWRFGTVNAAVGGREPLQGSLGREAWNGAGSGNISMWFTPSHLSAASHGTFLLEYPDRDLTYAELGIVVEYASGDRRPMVLLFILDPTSRVWWMAGLDIRNYKGWSFPPPVL